MLYSGRMRSRATPPHVRLGGVAFAAALLFMTVTPACNSVGSQCSDFCERWRECVDGNVSVDACENACESWADGNAERETKLDKCGECLDQNDACTDTNRRCAADCLGIPVR
jgi:hypothetical protein